MDRDAAPDPLAADLQAARRDMIPDLLAGKGALRRHAALYDRYFERAHDRIRKREPRLPAVTLTAVGGYGRAEQCLHSDIDLLFLFDGRVPGEAADLVRQIVYPLWDIGLQVGHATRSIDECCAMAAEHPDVLTAMLDARFLAGRRELFDALADGLRRRVIDRRTDEIITTLVRSSLQRHARFGDATYLLEPNIKEGRGGLRDYHAMLWLARVRSRLNQPRDLEYHGYLSHTEFGHLQQALGIIWDIRNQLHHITGRKCDQLHIEHLEALAGRLGMASGSAKPAVERLLERVHGRLEAVKHQFGMFLQVIGHGPRRPAGCPPAGVDLPEGVAITRSVLHFSSAARIIRHPPLLIAIFVASARHDLPLSVEARRLVREFVFLVDTPGFRNDHGILRQFEEILVQPARSVNVLHEMLTTGFLAAYLPGFQAIVNRVQYSRYHIYPVDKHALRTVQVLKEFGTAEGDRPTLHQRMYRDLDRPHVLLWAALLHDVGKGSPGPLHAARGAHLARGMLGAKGLTPRAVAAVAFLIREHLHLVHTATRRDIHDEETAIATARKIGTVARLNMLYLLTVADSMATGPKAWNDWTAGLLRDLYFKVLNIIEGGELGTRRAVVRIARKKARVLQWTRPAGERPKVKALLRQMSPRYLLETAPQVMQEHIALCRRRGEAPFEWAVTPAAAAGMRTVTVCAPDRPGLFARIAGSFTLNGISIRHAQIYTWRNGTALDIFQVTAPRDPLREAEIWQKTHATLTAVLTDRLDLAAALRRAPAPHDRGPALARRDQRVVVDNRTSSFFTIVEVYTQDFPGVLYRLTDALTRSDVSVWVAKIATTMHQVVDVFYVRGLEGQKITRPERVDRIRRNLLAVLPGSPAGPPED